MLTSLTLQLCLCLRLYPSLVQMFKEWLYSSGPNTKHRSYFRYFTGAAQDNASHQCPGGGGDGDTGIMVVDIIYNFADNFKYLGENI